MLSGSDTSGNALFGNLQVVAARQLDLNPVLFAATNSSGGVMGKMISPQNIATGVSVTRSQGPGRRGVRAHVLAQRRADDPARRAGRCRTVHHPLDHSGMMPNRLRGLGHLPPPPYDTLLTRLSSRIPADRLITDPLRLLAWGTDASFYRLDPQARSSWSKAKRR